MKTRKLYALAVFLFLLPQKALAHCPLCTAGAAVAAGGALWLGVKASVIGLFVGAFAVSLGWWIGKSIKKEYLPFQKQLLIALSFALTVVPLVPILQPVSAFYLDIAGEYGSLLNRTYVINLFLVGSLIGAFIVCISPWISKKLTHLRNDKMLPFQGITLTFTLLLLISLFLQWG